MSQLSLDIMHIQRSGLRQAGFSLVELMVAMVISLLIMAAVLTLFLDVTRTNDDMAKTNVQIENGRFSLQMIGNDLMHAGFWDGYIPEYDDLTATTEPAGYPDTFTPPEPCLGFASWTPAYTDNLLRMPVQSFPEVPAGCEGIVKNHKVDTDVLVVRHINNCVADSDDCDASNPSRVYFQTSFCSEASPYDYVLDKSGFTLQKRDCENPADKRRLVMHIYFIRDDDTLMRAEFVAGDDPDTEWSVQPMIDGVEHFVVELGVDNLSDSGEDVDYEQPVLWADPLNKVSPRNRGDGAPDGDFVRCPEDGCDIEQLLNVVAAKLYLLVRSPQESVGYTDNKTYTLGSADPVTPGDSFKRHLYSTSVRLHNVSARRETP
jgi:type IV pilus assembly protein PilW